VVGLRRFRPVRLALAAVIGAGAAAFAQQPVKTFSERDVTQGVKMTAAQCARLPKAVYVTSFGEGVCIRYYLGAPAKGKQTAVFLSGDVLGLNKQGNRVAEPGYLTAAPEYLDAAVRVWSRRFELPVIFLARPGIYGSSGWQGDRRTVFEVDVTMKALAAIKAKEGITAFHVAGQSGGALLAAAAVAERDDIVCAAIASGPLDLRAFLASDGIPWRTDGRRAHYDMMAKADIVAAKTAAGVRLMMLTDPADRFVPAPVQAAFADAVEAAGGKVLRIETTARGADHHALTEKALFSLAMCANGHSDAAILNRYGHSGADDLPPP
jgi:alpha-beta hydrolase superfamily lysophospholipase